MGAGAVTANSESATSGNLSTDDAFAIIAIINEFAYLVDHGRATECEALFTQDARITFGPGTPKPGTLEGIAAIRGFLKIREAQANVTSRHSMSNIRLVRTVKGEVEACSLLTLFRSDNDIRLPVVAFVAEIEELYVRRPEGGWLIRERLISPTFLPFT